ncbi:MAG: hypothetical protein ACTSPY_11855 [Candidatus Helarchaeota archaeon]
MDKSDQKKWALILILFIDGFLSLIISIFIFPDMFVTFIGIVLLVITFLIPIIYINKEIKFPFIPLYIILFIGSLGILYLIILILNPILFGNNLAYLIFLISGIIYLIYLYVIEKKSPY